MVEAHPVVLAGDLVAPCVTACIDGKTELHSKFASAARPVFVIVASIGTLMNAVASIAGRTALTMEPVAPHATATGGLGTHAKDIGVYGIVAFGCLTGSADSHYIGLAGLADTSGTVLVREAVLYLPSPAYHRPIRNRKWRAHISNIQRPLVALRHIVCITPVRTRIVAPAAEADFGGIVARMRPTELEARIIVEVLDALHDLHCIEVTHGLPFAAFVGAAAVPDTRLVADARMGIAQVHTGFAVLTRSRFAGAHEVVGSTLGLPRIAGFWALENAPLSTVYIATDIIADAPVFLHLVARRGSDLVLDAGQKLVGIVFGASRIGLGIAIADALLYIRQKLSWLVHDRTGTGVGIARRITTALDRYAPTPASHIELDTELHGCVIDGTLRRFRRAFIYTAVGT